MKKQAEDETGAIERMAPEEVFQKAAMAMTRICAATAECHSYGWGDEFKAEHIASTFLRLKEDEVLSSELFWRKVFDLPEEKKSILGFIHFSEGEGNKMCIPLWIWCFLPDDMVLEGGVKKDLDNDNRFGCVWWQA